MPLTTCRLQLEWLRAHLIGDLKPSLILWTGDSVSHDIRHMTEEHVVLTLETLTNLIKEFFPDVPLIASLGNHDFEPANYQDFSESESNYI
jgi:predicted MPP superfamily phosphohydrolase